MAATRNTSRKEAILSLLEADFEELVISGKYPLGSETGYPPFTATDIARFCPWYNDEDNSYDDDRPPASVVQSYARTLRGMVKEGLVVSVRHKTLTRNAIIASQRAFDCDIPMMQTCYYSAKAMARHVAVADAKAAHAKWCEETPGGRAYAKQRTDAMLDGLFGARPVQPTTAQLHGDVIDGCIREVSDANDICVRAVLSAPTVGPDGEWQLF